MTNERRAGKRAVRTPAQDRLTKLLRRWRATVRVFDDRGLHAGGTGEAGDPAVAFRRAVSAAIRGLGGIEVGGAS